MREIIARAVCVLTVCVVVALSLWFASMHNRPAPAGPERPVAAPAPVGGGANAAVRMKAGQSEPPPEAAAKLGSGERGPAVFAQQNCATCHSIAGVGNPRYPLDGVGDRRGPGELRMWIMGTGVAAGKLPSAIEKRKQRYQALSEEDMSSLVAYLAARKLPPR